MARLRNLPISSKFAYAFGIVGILCIVLGAYTFVTLRDIAVKNLDVSDKAVPAALSLANAGGAANTVRRTDLAVLLCNTAECHADKVALRRKSLEEYDAALKIYAPTVSYPGERELYQKFSSAFAQYREASD